MDKNISVYRMAIDPIEVYPDNEYKIRVADIIRHLDIIHHQDWPSGYYLSSGLHPLVEYSISGFLLSEFYPFEYQSSGLSEFSKPSKWPISDKWLKREIVLRRETSSPICICCWRKHFACFYKENNIFVDNFLNKNELYVGHRTCEKTFINFNGKSGKD